MRPAVTLRLSLLPFLLALLLASIALPLVARMLGVGADGGRELSGLPGVVVILASIALWAFAAIWVAVAWHRHVLLGEPPQGVLPRFHGRRMLNYLGWMALIIITALLLFIVAGVPLASLSGAVTWGAPGFSAISLITSSVVGLLVNTVLVWLFYCVAPTLPAAALGNGMTLGDAWRETKDHSGTLLLLALLTAVCGAVLNQPWHLALTGRTALILSLWRAVVSWVKIMVGISILTTIYDYCVVKHPRMTD